MQIWHEKVGDWIEVAPGVKRRVLSTSKTGMLVLFRLRKNAVVPKHTHVEEQYGYVIQGKAKFESSNGVNVLKTGDSYLIRSGEEHGVVAQAEPESLVLDVFIPCRTDYLPASRKPDIS